MKRTFALLTVIAMALGVMATAKDASAVPAFARQTGNACNACHFQFFPKLSAMGRAFKLGGLTDASVDLIGKEDEGLSIPANLPLSFIFKLRYLQDTKTKAGNPKAGNERGSWQIPDEATLYLGGRAASNVGYSLEYAASGWAKASLLIGLPVGGDMKAGIYVNGTDGHGPFNGFDLFNTASIRAIRGFENRSAAYAWQKTGFGHEATGLGVYVGSEMWYANVGLWGPADFWSGTVIDTGFDLAMLYRVAFTPSVGGFDLMIGVAGSSGSVKCVDCGEGEEVTVTDSSGKTTTTTKKKLHEMKIGFMGVDLQAQGEVAGMSLEVQASMVNTEKDKAFPAKEQAATNVIAFLGVTPAAGVKAGIMNYDDKKAKKKTDATNLGVWYNLAQNLTLSVDYSIFGGDGRSNDNQMILMLFGGF